ncbi:hypothetical protein AVEN_25618-1 [Araneus ventricosus]|uniref:Uncharacterized protein n=1 Tax=Araneus ventricosus TaxID=182803 RepID=A0A4Y2BNH3_ARAVE|nr:hypothetical protein AVEN_25618-1 [Araneus ventricosus]
MNGRGVLTAISDHGRIAPVGNMPHHVSGGYSTSHHPPTSTYLPIGFRVYEDGRRVLTAISGHGPAPPVGDKPHHRSGGNSTSHHPPMAQVDRFIHRV